MRECDGGDGAVCPTANPPNAVCARREAEAQAEADLTAWLALTVRMFALRGAAFACSSSTLLGLLALSPGKLAALRKPDNNTRAALRFDCGYEGIAWNLFVNSRHRLTLCVLCCVVLCCVVLCVWDPQTREQQRSRRGLQVRAFSARESTCVSVRVCACVYLFEWTASPY